MRCMFRVIVAVAVLTATVAPVSAQRVTLRIADKTDQARANLRVTYRIDAVNSRTGQPIRIAEGPLVTDAAGRLTFGIPSDRLGQLATPLEQGKEIRITIIADSSYGLNPLTISSLAGTQDQSFAVVMKAAAVPTYQMERCPPPCPRSRCPTYRSCQVYYPCQ